MVAEIGGVTMEPVSPEGKKKEGQVHTDKLRAKKAIILARKRSTSAKVTRPGSDKTTCEDDATLSTERKKKKKYVPAPWLCENMTVKSEKQIRSDVYDAVAFCEGKVQPGCYDHSYEAELDEFYDGHEVKSTRLKGKMPFSVHVRNLSSLNQATRRKLEDSVREYGRKKVIRCDFLVRLMARDEEINYAKEMKNKNTERVLELKDLKRRCVIKEVNSILKPKAEEPKPKVNYARQKRHRGPNSDRRKPRWTNEQREKQIYVPHEFELHAENVECDDPEETNLMCFLLDLQQRDMTPEDYEMLLRLDEKVAPKTVAADKLASLRTETISDSTAPNGVDGIPWGESLCTVCMESYEEGHVVTYLPCKHVFHAPCIEMWLNNSGNTCPLDGMEV